MEAKVYTTKIQKAGRTIFIYIPKEIEKKLDLKKGDDIMIMAKGEYIVITKINWKKLIEK